MSIAPSSSLAQGEARRTSLVGVLIQTQTKANLASALSCSGDGSLGGSR